MLKIKRYGCAPRHAMLALILLAGGAWAVDLGQAKASGWVCEQADGYLRATGGPGDVAKMVNGINGQRQAAYAGIAKKRGVAVAQVAQITAQKVIKQAPQFACK